MLGTVLNFRLHQHTGEISPYLLRQFGRVSRFHKALCGEITNERLIIFRHLDANSIGCESNILVLRAQLGA